MTDVIYYIFNIPLITITLVNIIKRFEAGNEQQSPPC